MENKQKQIEEMAKDLKEEKLYALINKTSYMRSAENLINAGYRKSKIPENAVVLTREEYEELKKGIKTYNYTAMFDAQNAYRWEQGYLQGTKETAEKFAERLKKHYPPRTDERCTLDDCYMLDVIDEICKEITEGGND